MRILLAGYQTTKIEELRAAQAHFAARIVDIRFTPRSMNPVFSHKQLSETFGPNYLWLKAFGNRNFKSGPVMINDFAAGLAVLRQLEESSCPTAILLCACWDIRSCHRTVVGERLRERGFSVSELSKVWKAPSLQKELF